MPRFPGYGLPFQYYRPYARNNFYNNYTPQPPVPEPTSPQLPVCEEKPKLEETRSIKKPKQEDPVWLDIFGIKLYFDDVLILSLLFFLYKEEVKDEGLFLALVLLLIS